MSVKDREKWDKKYVIKPQLLMPREASGVLKKYMISGAGKSALDLACGAGRNSCYLARLGYKVDAVDIAEIALKSLEKEALTLGVLENIALSLEDLDTFSPKIDTYSLIIMMNYLDRDLIERTKAALKIGGHYIVETYMVDAANEKENSDQNNLLKPQELKDIFSDGFEIIYYDEFENEKNEIYRMKKAVIVVKKL